MAKRKATKQETSLEKNLDKVKMVKNPVKMVKLEILVKELNLVKTEKEKERGKVKEKRVKTVMEKMMI